MEAKKSERAMQISSSGDVFVPSEPSEATPAEQKSSKGEDDAIRRALQVQLKNIIVRSLFVCDAE
jgi:hypothetical protein